jgi:transposase insK for insertion sequence
VLKVSRAGYYKWLNRVPSESEKRLRRLMELIHEVYESVQGIYGYRRITIYLNYYRNAKVNHKCIQRLMKLMGLKAVIRKKRYRYKSNTEEYTAANILNREFKKEYEPMALLLTDITELKYGKGDKAYLSAVLDYGTKKIVAYQISKQNNNQIVKDTFNQIKRKIIPTKTMIHSDRGFQYTSHFFKHFIEKGQITHSMSRPGRCIDNGPMESFWGTLKEEAYRLYHFKTYDSLFKKVEEYIQFYNKKRITLSMGLKIPA